MCISARLLRSSGWQRASTVGARSIPLGLIVDEITRAPTALFLEQLRRIKDLLHDLVEGLSDTDTRLCARLNVEHRLLPRRR